MVSVRPFIGQHIRPDFVRRVPAPAFDSMSGPERTEYLATHPESYTLVTRSPGDGGPNDAASTQELIDMGGAALQRIVESGAFEEVDHPALFLYRLGVDDHSQIGIVSLVAVQDTVLAALLVIDDDLQGQAGAARPTGIRRRAPIAHHVPRIAGGHPPPPVKSLLRDE